MSWELLKTDYQDAAFEGMRKYSMIENTDGTVSFVDVTVYTVKDQAFFGANDANKSNAAVNAILAALEDGTDLYEAFSNFFEEQENLFRDKMDSYMSVQQTSFGTWFDTIKNQLSTDAAGKLQNQLNDISYYYVLEMTLYLPQTSASASEGVLMLGTTIKEEEELS